MSLTISKSLFTTYQNQEIFKYRLTTASCFSIVVLNYGGIIWEINTPDKFGDFSNVVLNHGKFVPENPGFFGAITGRVAGRIKDARFALNNQEYQLAANNNNNLLHGGKIGLDKRIWEVSELANGLELSYFSPDGENGFPGNVQLTVRYLIEADMQLTIESFASSDCETPINLTNHSSFNLTGNWETGPRQVLQLACDYYGQIDNQTSFINQLSQVANTPFDFRIPKAIERDIFGNDQQLKNGGGYDHPFVLDQSVSHPIKLADPVSGRFLEMATSEPVVVVYSGNKLRIPRAGICLETQRMPNAINLAEYRESVLCSPTTPYASKTIWQFGVTQ